jgi:hypothetical protein
MVELTTSQVASRLGVGASTVRLWCTLKRFPRAYEVQSPRGPFWLIPEGDLEGFVVPKRGRPKKSANSVATLPPAEEEDRAA